MSGTPANGLGALRAAAVGEVSTIRNVATVNPVGTPRRHKHIRENSAPDHPGLSARPRFPRWIQVVSRTGCCILSYDIVFFSLNFPFQAARC